MSNPLFKFFFHLFIIEILLLDGLSSATATTTTTAIPPAVSNQFPMMTNLTTLPMTNRARIRESLRRRKIRIHRNHGNRVIPLFHLKPNQSMTFNSTAEAEVDHEKDIFFMTSTGRPKLLSTGCPEEKPYNEMTQKEKNQQFYENLALTIYIGFILVSSILARYFFHRFCGL